MASGTKLVLSFYSATGKTLTWTFNYAKPSAGKVNVVALMQAMITNGSIYATPPVEIKSAKEVTTTEQTYDLADLAKFYDTEAINANPEIDEADENTVVEVKKVEPSNKS